MKGNDAQMMEFMKKLLGTSNEAVVKKLGRIVDQVEALEPSMQALSDQELQNQTANFRRRLKGGETLDDLLPEAFATVREAGVRVIGQRAFPMQVLGGVVLHQGRIAEMKTGEGKTLLATLPVYLNALTGEGVHVVTVNDYLAKYQGEWMGEIYRFLGMSVGLILHDMDNEQRRASYACDITYGTNNEFGFDYLRDNMVVRKEDMVQRGHAFAIVDEVDSILIDEARTPLIISGMGTKSTALYTRANQFAVRLKNEEDFTVDEKLKVVNLTDDGVAKAESFFSVENLGDTENTELIHHIQQALKANVLMKRDRDYVVQNGQVVIVDEFTGRLMTGRRYSEGLHQAIEAKENVKVERESKTLATITFQNYFRMYKKLSGMTGTAKTEEAEFQGIYGLDVVVIPTTKPMIRKDENDVVYKTEKGKYAAVVEEIVRCHQSGQPVLVGTVSVAKSEILSEMLKRRGVKHEVLNAKNHAREAEIVAQAGRFGAVTIATNMAGRGTDIELGGNPDYMAKARMRQEGYADELIVASAGKERTEDPEVLAARETFQNYRAAYKKETDEEHRKVVEVGGLRIIGTERHESRRIDNQLRGRAGRQGDPGASRFYIALEDDLMRLFGSERIEGLVNKLGLEEDQPLEYGMLSKQIESAQKRVEARNFDTRKHVLQYDDVMNQQREIIYAQRRRVLMGEDVRQHILDMIHTRIEEAVDLYAGTSAYAEEWNLAGLKEYLSGLFSTARGFDFIDDTIGTKEEAKQKLEQAALELYSAKEADIADKGIDMREVERRVLLMCVDEKWMDHIDAMDQLRQGIGLRAYGQRDPVVEYKFEGYEMFEEMVHSIQEATVSALMRVSAERVPEKKQVATPTAASHGDEEEPAKKRPAVAAQKVGRNSPCPCGSGKKYKNCCGA